MVKKVQCVNLEKVNDDKHFKFTFYLIPLGIKKCYWCKVTDFERGYVKSRKLALEYVNRQLLWRKRQTNSQ